MEILNPDLASFAYRDLTGQDLWQSFTPVFTSLTIVGNATYSGRYRKVGRQCQFQASLVASTSIASTAGTTYMDLPIPAKGIAGIGVMSDDTTNILTGGCHIDVTNSRCYLPSRTASGDTFNLCGSYEI